MAWASLPYRAAPPVELTPRWTRQERIRRFLVEAARDWQQSHDLLSWFKLEWAKEIDIYAAALVDFVDTLVEERMKEKEEE